MKRILILFTLIFTVSISLLCTFSIIINNEKDTVTITENVLYGNKSYAVGLKITSRSHYKNRLYWTSEYTVSKKPEINTVYEFFLSEQSEIRPSPNFYFNVDDDIRFGFDFFTPAEQQEGLARVYKELYDSCKEGERKEKTVYLKDIYEYYPIRLDVHLKGVYWSNNDFENLWDDEEGGEKYVTTFFREFFKIPVLENSAVNISVGKNTNGHSMGSSYGSDSDGDYFFNTKSAVTEDTVFFTIDNKTRNKKQFVDFSLVPGGYGIYSFNYKNEGGLKYDVGILTDTLKMAYALDPQATVQDLLIANNGKDLILLETKNGNTALTTIDIKTMTKINEVIINNFVAHNIRDIGTGFLIISYENFALIDSNYQLKFTAPMMNYVNESFNFMDYTATAIYNGEKLVLVDSIVRDDFAFGKCGYYIAIYNETGLVYYGEYESSLDINGDKYNYRYNCNPLNDAYTIEILQ